MPTTSWCKKHRGQEPDCDRCPGPEYTVQSITVTCSCKCHDEKESK
jgi:hypothetical protein